MAPEVASPASKCPTPLCRCVQITSGVLFLVLVIILGVYSYKDIHNGMRMAVVGGSFQMNKSLDGSVTLRFTLVAENPTFCSVTYYNISATLAVLNEDPFLRFPLTDFYVDKRGIMGTPAFMEVPTHVTASATQLSMHHIDTADNNIALVLQLKGTVETSSRDYRCCISTSMDDKACSRVRSK